MDRIDLDPLNTDAGLFERVMLHETLSPNYDAYDQRDSLRTMRLMRQVFANWLKHRAYFGGSNVGTALDLLRVPGLFGEFDTYPRLGAVFMQHVTQILANANNPQHPDQRISTSTSRMRS